MTDVCKEFGISRKTGYKILNKYREFGIRGLTDRSTRPYKQANQLPPQIENLIIETKNTWPSWGARKIREKIRRKYPGRDKKSNDGIVAQQSLL